MLNAIAIDILFKLENLLRLLLVPLSFCGRRGKETREKASRHLGVWVEQTLDMNQFEMNNFKQQSKYAQLVFEDFLMLLLDLLVVVKVFSVPKIVSDSFSESGFFL